MIAFRKISKGEIVNLRTTTAFRRSLVASAAVIASLSIAMPATAAAKPAGSHVIAPASSGPGRDFYVPLPGSRHIGVKQPSACQGSPGTPNNSTLKGVQYIEFRTWTECFGEIDSITSYLELQKYELEYPGGPSEYVDVAGPDEAHFPGVPEKKFYQEASVKCSSVGGAGTYRSAAHASWTSEGLTGNTTWGYSSGAKLC
jgi:hypothetical protein